MLMLLICLAVFVLMAALSLVSYLRHLEEAH
jgi:hypothetical protein